MRQAAQDLAKSGEAGLATFSGKNATSVWKDSYTFVISCEGGTAVDLANPIKPELKGKPTAQSLTFSPAGRAAGRRVLHRGAEAARRVGRVQLPKGRGDAAGAQGGLPASGPGTTYVVGAGIYDPTRQDRGTEQLSGG